MKKITIGDDKLEFIDNDDNNIIVVLKGNETIISKEELMIVLRYLAKGDNNE